MTPRNRIKTVLSLAVVAILVLAIGQVQAAAIPINGDFTMYKPGTSYTVTAVFADGYASDFGDNLTVKGAGIADYSDGTSGGFVDCPGWVVLTGNNDLVANGVDGSTAFNGFGTWSSGNGTTAESAESLGALAASSDYTLSAMINGPAGPLVLELLAGGVALTPSFSVTPASPTNGWEEISRKYDAADLAAHVGEPMTIVLGTRAVPPEEYFGTRVRFDNVTFDVENHDPALPDVDAGDNMISWSGALVTLDPNVVNNDTGTLTYLWTASPDGIDDPNLDVAIAGAATEDASVTITKAEPTGDVTVITMTLAVTLEGKGPVKDSMKINVYDDACVAALDLDLTVIDQTDIDGNCITNFKDFALMAVTWLDDYELKSAVAK